MSGLADKLHALSQRDSQRLVQNAMNFAVDARLSAMSELTNLVEKMDDVPDEFAAVADVREFVRQSLRIAEALGHATRSVLDELRIFCQPDDASGKFPDATVPGVVNVVLFAACCDVLNDTLTMLLRLFPNRSTKYVHQTAEIVGLACFVTGVCGGFPAPPDVLREPALIESALKHVESLSSVLLRILPPSTATDRIVSAETLSNAMKHDGLAAALQAQYTALNAMVAADVVDETAVEAEQRDGHAQVARAVAKADQHLVNALGIVSLDVFHEAVSLWCGRQVKKQARPMPLRRMLNGIGTGTGIDWTRPPPGLLYSIYCDAGYVGSRHICVAKALPSWQVRRANSCRTSVENLIGLVCQLFAHLHLDDSVSIVRGTGLLFYWTACLLTNCWTCIKTSNVVASRFAVPPPSLEQYLSYFEEDYSSDEDEDEEE